MCKVEGCSSKVYLKEHCARHYAQMYRHGKILERTRFDPNEIVIKKDFAEIILYDRKGKEKTRAIIDIKNIDKIKKYKWYALKRKNHFIVCTNIPRKNCNLTRKKSFEYLANIIMDFNSSHYRMIDHIDRNSLNNRESNFRICSQSQNLQNRKAPSNNTSGFKGVSWNKKDKRWRAEICSNKKRRILGHFKDKNEAVVAYNKAALKYHNDFACLNNI